MMPLAAAAAEFLSHKRIAIAGVSASGPNAANIIYRRMREDGYQVFAVNPHADYVEGDVSYHSIGEIPGGVDGVVVGTTPVAARTVAQECIELKVPRVWFHRSIGHGSYSGPAVDACEHAGISVIAGACPMMFLQHPDSGHRCLKWFFSMTGKLPRECTYHA